MIKYITPDIRQQILEMWRICFGDSQPYYDIYFREKYKDENTLAYFVGDKVVASLQFLHYNFTFYDIEIPVAYISGACTLPEARKQGYMAALLKEALRELVKRKKPLSILVPEEEWLLRFYDKYGYAQTFDKGADLPSLKKILDRNSNNLLDTYKDFDSLFRNQVMTVQKSFDDFRVLLEEAAGYDYPTKKSLVGMTRVIDAYQMMQLYAKKHPKLSFTIEISDDIISQNNLFLSISNGEVTKTLCASSIHLKLSIYELAQALLGYRTLEKPHIYKDMFPEHKPQIHYMME